MEEPTRSPYKYTITYAPKPATFFWFSTTELKHLILGTLLVMGVGLSFTPYIGLAVPMWPSVLVSLAIVLTLSFLLHELAHKFSAQRLGLWAEFRLTMQGALVTLISILLPFFKIISPGAVMIAGPVTREIAGKTAFTGPLVNIVLSAVCIAISMAFLNTFFWVTAVFGAWINALIAFFNLIPFGPMDGLKVFRWNREVWILTFVTAFALMVYTYGTIL